MQYAGVAARRYHEDKLGARVKVRAADRIQYAQFNEAMRKARDERTEKRLLIVIVRQSVRSVRSLTPPDSIAGISARFPNRNSTSVRSLGSSCLKLRAGAGSLRLRRAQHPLLGATRQRQDLSKLRKATEDARIAGKNLATCSSSNRSATAKQQR